MDPYIDMFKKMNEESKVEPDYLSYQIPQSPLDKAVQAKLNEESIPKPFIPRIEPTPSIGAYHAARFATSMAVRQKFEMDMRFLSRDGSYYYWDHLAKEYVPVRFATPSHFQSQIDSAKEKVDAIWKARCDEADRLNKNHLGHTFSPHYLPGD